MSDFYKIEGIDDIKDENGYLSVIKKTEREKKNMEMIYQELV